MNLSSTTTGLVATVEVDQHVAVRIVRGREAVLALQPELAALTARCGLPGEVDFLDYFLTLPAALRKTPYLVLLSGPLEGAVLLFEYRIFLGGTGVFATSDTTGRRCVLAAPNERAQVAAVASRALLESGAQMVHVAFSLVTPDSDEHSWNEELRQRSQQEVGARLRVRRLLWALDQLDVPLYLKLRESFDETLAYIGQKTRFNLRYYRRRLEKEAGSVFVPEVQVSEEEFLAFNRECSFAVPDEVIRLRYRAQMSFKNGFMCGVKDREGRWLSMVGGRLYYEYAEIDWQQNREGMSQQSLATVMRSYLIEHLVGRGLKRLYIEGGTPQPIAYSFVPGAVGELTVRRRSLFAILIKRFAAHIFPRRNYLGQTLLKRELEWRHAEADEHVKNTQRAS